MSLKSTQVYTYHILTKQTLGLKVLERFVDDYAKVKYRNVLQAEVSWFAESIKHQEINGSESVDEVLEEWEGNVNRVPKTSGGSRKRE